MHIEKRYLKDAYEHENEHEDEHEKAWNRPWNQLIGPSMIPSLSSWLMLGDNFITGGTSVFILHMHVWEYVLTYLPRPTKALENGPKRPDNQTKPGGFGITQMTRQKP